jgi:predicted PurR-regulated permease PerM
MELFGGFMVMLWMVGFFLTVIWFILPFVIFSIKNRVEEIAQVINTVEKRLANIENEVSTCRLKQNNDLPH